LQKKYSQPDLKHLCPVGSPVKCPAKSPKEASYRNVDEHSHLAPPGGFWGWPQDPTISHGDTSLAIKKQPGILPLAKSTLPGLGDWSLPGHGEAYGNCGEWRVRGCKNPRDSTPLLGEDTSCAYHRLLFDLWICDGVDPRKLDHYMRSQKGRRRAFTNWMRKLGKAKCDEIVLKLAQESINWEC